MILFRDFFLTSFPPTGQPHQSNHCVQPQGWP